MINLLFVGDVFGNNGKWILSKVLKRLRADLSIDLCIANGENIAGGRGLTGNLLSKLRSFGVDVVTTGNHIWDNPDIIPFLSKDERLLRPLNYPEGNIGRGSTILALPSGVEIAVINLQGRVFMPAIDCPFVRAMSEVDRIRARTHLIVIDFHAEATSEKQAMGWYLDGKVSAVIGTHTHVQTADERILPNGTAYITDAGMTGPHDSVIGMKRDLIVRKLILQSYVRFEPSEAGAMFEGVFIRLDEDTGKAVEIRRVREAVAPDSPSVPQ